MVDVPRRKNSKMTKKTARSILGAVLNMYGGVLVSSFELRILRDKNRMPTDGERMLFEDELSKEISRLNPGM